MTAAELTEIAAKALREPTHAVIRASLQSCGYTVDGYDPLLIDTSIYEKGSTFRPLPKEGYPLPTKSYCVHLFSDVNMNVPFMCPNVYHRTPAWPTMLQRSLLGKALITTEAQQLKAEGSVVFAQALAQQASSRLRETIEAEEVDMSSGDLDYCQGVAAGLAAGLMLHPTIRPDCSKITTAAASVRELQTFAPFIEKSVAFAVDVGPITDMVKRPLSFVHVEPHETLAVLQKGQVC